ncbi:class I SAM-dependent methyltransferase [Actinokineospora iranica]|uniref:Methyltransferase domain-containing protein n=1 Tax=Actinokineospora iranica TaxID=1271860 RepID=A0A1G6TNP7_9PSEU|nr:class I SAM-dependent methyltransferase [Actinokineospora iranica]SDD30671.1 Methyltransferase domain-containing protein [Actinokineospora iranica]
MTPPDVFAPGLLGRRCWLELADGQRISLPVDRWGAAPDRGDEVLLDACSGPTLDVGCGPGRLTAALTRRGVAALGVDISPVAVALTRSRGAVALRRDVYDPLPGEGLWRHVLLADGNVGIGGDPVALLRRMRELLSRNGSALVESDRPGRGVHAGRARVSRDSGSGPWFDWAWLGADSVPWAAAEAGFAVRWTREHLGRWFTELVPV